MNQNIRKKLETYKDTQEDTHGNGIYSHSQKAFHGDSPFILGIVADNRDPECLGRVRVQLDLLSPGCVSPWCQMSGRWTGGGHGFWTLPDIGTQVLVAFPAGDKRHGIVLGCLYDEKHLPPETSPEKKADSILLQTRSHRIEITDEAGKEGISIESAAGKMRCVLDKENGIQIANGLGDIKVNCRKLKAASGKNVELNGTKKVSVSCDGTTGIKSGKGTKITCDKNAGIEGKNIKLNGSSGVCAEGKQMAAQDDSVMGMDVHIMVIPSGPSTTTAPLPHPFIGKLNDGLSDDVSIGDKKAAAKGSKAKHDDPAHMQLPGTIKFQNSPKKEGEVTGGTSPTVKIDGKEAAVIGSLVTTCNDIGARNNSTVIAAGAGMPMPAIINPSNTEEFERERKEQENIEPRFSDVKWSAATVAEGEEAELTAGVQDIADGNMVSLLVFPEGKGPEDSVPIASFQRTVKGGSVSAKWSHRTNRSEMPPEKNPRFVFTAHCAWCSFGKSSNALEVKLIRPEITKAEWLDKDGKPADKGLVGEALRLHAETKDMEDGSGVTFHVYDEHKREVYSAGADVKNNAADAEWSPVDIRKTGDRSELRYTVGATAIKCRAEEGDSVQIKNPQVVSMEWNKAALYYGDSAVLKIKTFELSDEKPVCKLVLFDEYFNKNKEFLYEKEIKINKDDIEEEIEFSFPLKNLNLTRNDLELLVSANLLDRDGRILNKDSSIIRVGIGFAYE